MNNVAQRKGKILKDLIEASQKEKKDFTDLGETIDAYGHKADDRKIYEGLGIEAELWFRTTVALTAQAKDLICPYLYPTNPYRCGKVRQHPFSDPQVQQIANARNGLMQSYLNYTPEETDLYGESVRAINQSQSYGAGVLWTGFNERKKLVHSVYDDVDNLEIDPNAQNWNEVDWIARKRLRPRWELLDEFPKQKQIIAGLKPDKASKSQIGKPNDLISTYEVWLRVGIHRFIEGGLPSADDNGNPITYTDQPRKYVVTLDEGKLLSEGSWEAPLYMDDLWPCEIVSYVEDKSSIWPISPMRAALPFQRALNWLYIWYMTKIRFCSRSLFGILETPETEVTDDMKKALESWNDLPFLTVRTSNNQAKIGDIFQQLNLNPGLDQFEKAHAIIKREFQEHSGLYDILHYGESDTQDRSATTTNFKDKTSKTRINYRLDRVIKWQGKLARKEALMARFLHTPQQIDTILGAGAGKVWGQIMPPQQRQVDPMTGAVAPPDPSAVDFQQWLLEVDYTIESTSMRRHDIDSKIDSLKDMMNQTVPTQLQSTDPMEKAMAYDTMSEYYEAIGGSDDLVEKQRQMAAYLRGPAVQQAQQAQQQAQQAQQAQVQQEQQAEAQKQQVDGQQKMVLQQDQHVHERAMQAQKLQAETAIALHKEKLRATRKPAEVA